MRKEILEEIELSEEDILNYKATAFEISDFAKIHHYYIGILKSIETLDTKFKNISDKSNIFENSQNEYREIISLFQKTLIATEMYNAYYGDWHKSWATKTKNLLNEYKCTFPLMQLLIFLRNSELHVTPNEISFKSSRAKPQIQAIIHFDKIFLNYEKGVVTKSQRLDKYEKNCKEWIGKEINLKTILDDTKKMYLSFHQELIKQHEEKVGGYADFCEKYSGKRAIRISENDMSGGSFEYVLGISQLPYDDITNMLKFIQ